MHFKCDIAEAHHHHHYRYYPIICTANIDPSDSKVQKVARKVSFKMQIIFIFDLPFQIIFLESHFEVFQMDFLHPPCSISNRFWKLKKITSIKVQRYEFACALISPTLKLYVLLWILMISLEAREGGK